MSDPTCASCGAPADHACTASVHGLTCGAPLCSECWHVDAGHVRQPGPRIALARAQNAWERAKAEAAAMDPETAQATLADLFSGLLAAERDCRSHLASKRLGEM